MSSKKRPVKAVYADQKGNIFEHPSLLMLCRKGKELVPPRPGELIPLPEESDIFLLPGRKALGLDWKTGQIEIINARPVAAFVSPGYTLSGWTAYYTTSKAPTLPLFAYGAIGYYQGRFWICGQKVDSDPRQKFIHISKHSIQKGTKDLLKAFPDNRLISHLAHCALTYCCPAAKNLALGRYEAPLPTSQNCNANCLGCISKQSSNSGFQSTQERIAFRPTPEEIRQVMSIHAQKEKKPIFSFGQGCEGEPLLEANLIAKAILAYRDQGGQGTININTNASLPETIGPLAKAGLNSIRVSLNSANPQKYLDYFRPKSYSFEQVCQTIQQAKENNLFVSLNLFFCPGITDSEEEYKDLSQLLKTYKIDFIQLRNLNLDPELYVQLFPDLESPCMGLNNFIKRLQQDFPWLGIGYFNPFLEETGLVRPASK